MTSGQPSTTYSSRGASLSGIGPVGAADDDVLDARAVLADQVDPGLDREGHPLAKRLAVAGDDVRVLVALEADAVPGPVEEGVAIPSASIGRLAAASTSSGATPGANRPRRRRLGAVQDAEQVPEALVRTLLGDRRR